MKVRISFILIIIFPIIALAGGDKVSPTTRDMNLITWTEFLEFVPAKIETVLLPVGSIEPHGVIPNGTDSIAPTAMAREIAPTLNAMIAPTLNYGVTPAMQAYPGAITISEKAYHGFLRDIVKGLANNRFKNIIILNGHGGNTSILKTVSTELSAKHRIRILVVNWWSLAAEDTQAVFGENGGHAGNNETAYMQAVVPQHIHPQRYKKNMAMPNPKANAWYAVPVAATIGLYEKGQGYPTFDAKQAKEYFKRVNDRVTQLVKKIIKQWDQAKLYRKY